MKVNAAVAIIPARFNSTRFPGKPIVEVDGKPLIEHVYRRVEQATLVTRTIVATDDKRIADAVERFGGTAIMTRNDHVSGTDRLAEAAQELPPEMLVVNVQGDEPMIDPSDIDKAITAARIGDAEIVTLMTKIDSAEADDPNRVKVVTGRNGIALYFSRSRIPSRGTCFLHVGLYVYHAGFLRKFTKLERTPLEIAERLEQLRALEHGYRIRVVEVESQSWGIDTPEDLDQFKELRKSGGVFPSSQRRGGAAKRKPDRAQPQEKRRGGQFGEMLRRSDHPVCAASVASPPFVDGAATLPLRGGECGRISTERAWTRNLSS